MHGIITMNESLKMTLILAAILSLIVIIGLYISRKTGHPAYIAITVALTSIVSFFGMLIVSSSAMAVGISEGAYRIAIASALIIEYVLLVSITAFTKPAAPNQQPNLISQTLISNFTVVIGIVLAFYFGASAYVETRQTPNTANVSQSVSK
jgi:hypothetical protein